jgi:hypothetical protein
VFSDLETFYQSQLRVEKDLDTGLKVPARQKRWFEDTWKMRKPSGGILSKSCSDRNTSTPISCVCFSTPLPFWNFLLPEFTALGNLDLTGSLYLNSRVTEYILKLPPRNSRRW